MADLQAQRTLVKSPPELWAELSNPESLGRRLAEFGEIRITRLVPEQTVAWEGERASGTVELESSGRATSAAPPAPDQRRTGPGPAERSAARMARRAAAAAAAADGTVEPPRADPPAAPVPADPPPSIPAPSAAEPPSIPAPPSVGPPAK